MYRITFKNKFILTLANHPNKSTSLKLLFEDRTISILAYNTETVLAEKIETILSRGVANKRMRDFYDVFALDTTHETQVDEIILKSALANTCNKRGSEKVVLDAQRTLREVLISREMMELWTNYQRKFDYALGLHGTTL